PVSPSLRPHGRAAPAYSVAVSPPRPASRLSLHDALPILLQPFIGCVVAAFLPQNARRAEAWLAATVAVAGFVVAALFYPAAAARSEEHTSELQSRENLVCRLQLEKKSTARTGAPLRPIRP